MKRSSPNQRDSESSNANKYGRFLLSAEPSSISLLVTTSRPPPAVTTSGMGGTLNLIDVESGTVQTSARIQGGDLQHSKQQLGLQSIALLPAPPPCPPLLAKSCPTMAIGYGVSDDKKDSFAVFMTIRNNDGTSLPTPIVHWRCRLPELMSAGLIISPVTSRHVIGAGSSGNLYVWDVWNQGNIIRSAVGVHYRSISCMIWSTPIDPEQTILSLPWECNLITAGIDGIVHVFTHADLVEDILDQEAPERLMPIRTCSKHQLAVRALVALPGGRFVSSGDDGLVLLMDMASEAVLLSVQLPNAIRTLAHDDGSLLAGSIKGTIHRIDLDEYAAERARERGANLPLFNTGKSSATLSIPANLGKVAELKGHTRPISALTILGQDQFVSGDESGILRVWKHHKCVRIIQPWNHGGSSATAGTTSTALGKKPTEPPLRPVSAIHVLYNYQCESVTGSSLSFMNSRSTKGDASWPSLVSPLQKYPIKDGSQYKIPIPYLKYPKFDPPCLSHDFDDDDVEYDE